MTTRAGRRGWSVAILYGLAACSSSRADTTAAPSSVPAASASASPPASAVASASASAAPVVPPRPASTIGSPERGPNGCWPEMARIGRYCIDKYEAHLVELDQDGAEVLHAHFERPAEGARYYAKSAADVFPQGYISRIESEAACRAAQKRLCSFDEWRRACQGKLRRSYPYGAREKAGACNSNKQHLLPQLFGYDTRKWEYDKHFNSPLLDQKEGYLEKTGARAGCASDEGVFDLVGNLHEWVNGTVTDDFVDRMDAEPFERHDQHWRTGNGIFVGGFYSTGSQLGPGCYYTTIAHEPRYHDYSTGFRCCADAPPDPSAKPPPKPRVPPKKTAK